MDRDYANRVYGPRDDGIDGVMPYENRSLRSVLDMAGRTPRHDTTLNMVWCVIFYVSAAAVASLLWKLPPNEENVTFLSFEIPRVVPQFVIVLFGGLLFMFGVIGTARIIASRRLFSAAAASASAASNSMSAGGDGRLDSGFNRGSGVDRYDRFGNSMDAASERGVSNAGGSGMGMGMAGSSSAGSGGRSSSVSSQFSSLSDRQRMLLGLPVAPSAGATLASGRREGSDLQRRLPSQRIGYSPLPSLSTRSILSSDYKSGLTGGGAGGAPNGRSNASGRGGGSGSGGGVGPGSGVLSPRHTDSNGSAASGGRSSLLLQQHMLSPTTIHPGASPQRARAIDSSVIVDQRSLDQFLDKVGKKEVEFVSSVAAAANAAYGQMDLFGSPVSNRSPYGSSAAYRSPYQSQLPSGASAAGGYGSYGSYGSPLASMQPSASTVSPFASSPSYQSAYRDVPDPSTAAGSDKLTATDERSDLELAEAAEKLYRELGVDEYVGRWGQQARSWLTAAIIQPLARDFRDSQKALEALAIEILASPSVVMLSADDRSVLETAVHSRAAANAAGSNGSGSGYSATGMVLSSTGGLSGTSGGGAAAANQAQLDHSLVSLFTNNPAYSATPAVVARKRLERYLAIRLGGSLSGAGSAPVGTNVKAYALQRISELAKGQYMTAFRWDRGADWAGKPWASHLPTDTQLLLHVFLTFMDEVVLNFAKQNFEPFSEKRSTNVNIRKHLTIVQTREQPPYFYLSLPAATDDSKSTATATAAGSGASAASTSTASNTAPTEWRITPGQYNLFVTIALFVYYQSRHSATSGGGGGGGRIGSLPITDLSFRHIANVLD